MTTAPNAKCQRVFVLALCLVCVLCPSACLRRLAASSRTCHVYQNNNECPSVCSNKPISHKPYQSAEPRIFTRCARAALAMVMCPSVCPSVTSRYGIKTAERIELFFDVELSSAYPTTMCFKGIRLSSKIVVWISVLLYRLSFLSAFLFLIFHFWVILYTVL